VNKKGNVKGKRMIRGWGRKHKSARKQTAISIYWSQLI